MAGRAALIINPASGGAGKADLHRFEGIATRHGYALDILKTARTGHATELSRQAFQEGADLVIAAGGDGTINEAVNGLAGTSCPLALVPLGTANVLAREAGLPLEPEDSLKSALTLSPRLISLGRIDAGGQQRYFCLMAGAGFDARVVHDISPVLKRYSGKAAYVLKAIETLFLWDSPLLSVSVDGVKHTCRTAVVCNARRYGGSFVMAPDADITEPGFQVVMLKRAGRPAMLSFALSFSLGRHTQLRSVETVKGREVTIEGDTPIQIDGDDFATAPASISAVPDALRLVF